MQNPQPASPIITSEVSAASLTGPTLAPSSIATIFGFNFDTSAAQYSGRPPTTLGGVSVNVTDSAGTTRAAPLFYAGPRQINYEVPDEPPPAPPPYP